MALSKLPSRDSGWLTFYDYPENGCDHEFDDDNLFDETEHGGSMHCLHCGEVISFDFADSGD